MTNLVFGISVTNFFPWLASNHDPHITASQIAGIKAVDYWAWPHAALFLMAVLAHVMCHT
jgi:hypothetical protein